MKQDETNAEELPEGSKDLRAIEAANHADNWESVAAIA